jgi:hypothetical protein
LPRSRLGLIDEAVMLPPIVQCEQAGLRPKLLEARHNGKEHKTKRRQRRQIVRRKSNRLTVEGQCSAPIPLFQCIVHGVFIGKNRCSQGKRARQAAPLRFGLIGELFGLVGADEGVDDRLDLAAQDIGQVMYRQADAVVGQAVLREIVGADLRFAAPRADQ